MSRPSNMPISATARPSTMSVSQSHGSSGQARLQAKRQELEALQILKEQSARLANEVEKLSRGVDQLVDGGEAVAAVMASWSGVFRAIQIARDYTTLPADGDFDGESVRAIPETMVRLPVETSMTTDMARGDTST